VATLALYTLESIYVTLDGSNNLLAVADQSVNGYNLAELTSTNGGVWNATSFGGYPGCLQDGTDDAMVQTGGLANAAVGGTDNSFWVGITNHYIATGAGGDACWSFGNSASNNFMCRFVEGTAAVTEVRKRADDTGAGAGDGGTSTAWSTAARQFWEISSPGTTVSLNRTAPNTALAAYLTGTSFDVNACTANRFAIGCLYRTTASGFMNQRWAACHVLDATPTSGELIQLRSWFSRYISPPIVLSQADRIRRDRHIHAKHRPTTWKLSRNGVMIPAQDTKIVQVNGFARAA
jgi:hypothetical protein